MSDGIDLKFKMTRGDLISALRWQALHSGLLWLIFGVFVLRLAMEIYYLVTLGAVPDGNVFSPWIAIALIFFFFFPMIAVRFRTDPRLFDEQTWHFNNNGITFASSAQSSELGWDRLKKITLDGAFYQLHLSKQNVVLIPRRAFPNAQIESAFKDLIQRQVRTNLK